jgi:hypothetical protein
MIRVISSPSRSTTGFATLIRCVEAPSTNRTLKLAKKFHQQKNSEIHLHNLFQKTENATVIIDFHTVKRMHLESNFQFHSIFTDTLVCTIQPLEMYNTTTGCLCARCNFLNISFYAKIAANSG